MGKEPQGGGKAELRIDGATEEAARLRNQGSTEIRSHGNKTKV